MFQIGGLASGIDTGTLIDQLMLLERKPITMLQQRKTEISNRNSAFQSINTRLSTLRSKLTDLTLERNLKPKKVTSSAESALSATAGAGAADGTYKVMVHQLATSTSVQSSSKLANSAQGATALKDLKAADTTAVTPGTFTIGGARFEILSPNATLDNVIAALNVAGGKLPDVNYDPSAVAIFHPDGTPFNPIAGTNLTGLGPDAASLSDGRIQLDVAANPAVAVGSGSDTSNFLSVVGLTAPISDGTLRTGARLNVTQAWKPLNEDGANGANLATPVTGDATGAGSFKINGVEITYNANTDALNDVLNRINSSAAGVVASYNSIEDRIVLTNKATGNSAIGLEDVTGNFLAATGLLNGEQKTGSNARITVDGIAGTLESATNEFKNIIPGVVFTAKEAQSTEDIDAQKWISVSVAADTEGTINSIKSFIDEFNATVDAIEAARGDGKPLKNDSTLGHILSRLYRLVYEPIAGLSGAPNTLSAIGIGTTREDRKHLSLDEEKFRAALEANPDRVVELFNKGVATDDPTGVAGRLKSYLDEIGGAEGIFASRKDATDRQTKYIDDQIEKYEIRLEQRRLILTQQFTAMEKAVALMQSQQSAMLSQLGSLQFR